jgi:hypothetical protein
MVETILSLLRKILTQGKDFIKWNQAFYFQFKTFSLKLIKTGTISCNCASTDHCRPVRFGVWRLDAVLKRQRVGAVQRIFNLPDNPNQDMENPKGPHPPWLLEFIPSSIPFPASC